MDITPAFPPIQPYPVDPPEFRRMRLATSTLCAVGVLAASAISQPFTTSLFPSKDNTLYENSLGTLSNGAGAGLFVGVTFNNAARRTLIAFDVAGSLPPGAVVLSANLTMELTMTQVGATPVGLHPVDQDWGEAGSVAPGLGGQGGPAQPGDATWIHAFSPGVLWVQGGGDFRQWPSAVATVDQPGTYTWPSNSDVVADVQQWLDQPSTNFGWLLLADETTFSAKRFASREDGALYPMPSLSITWQPGPAPSAVPTGEGCYLPFAPSPCRFRALSPPMLGNLGFALQVSSAPPSSAVSVYLANTVSAAPLLLGACEIYLDIPSAIANINAGLSPLAGFAAGPDGVATIPVPLGFDPAFVGFSVSIQALASGAAGAVTSNALTLNLY